MLFVCKRCNFQMKTADQLDPPLLITDLEAGRITR